MKAWGDEYGMLWQNEAKPPRVGRSASREKEFRIAPPPADYSLPTLFPRIDQASRISIDIETFDPHLKEMGPGAVRRDGYIVGIGVRTDDWIGDYYPVRHAGGSNCDIGMVFNWLRDNLVDYRGTLVGANLLYEGQWLDTEGVTFHKAKIEDVQWAEPLLDENQLSYKLDSIAQRRIGKRKEKLEVVSLYGKDFINQFHRVHPGHAKGYVMGDINLPMEIIDVQKEQLKKENLLELFQLECRLFPLLLQMKLLGVRVDTEAAQRIGEQMKEQRKERIARMRQLVGFDVEVWSATHVSRAFDKVGVPYPSTLNGAPSFTKPWLEAMEDECELAKLVLDVRKIEKFKGTFLGGYILKGSHHGRIHSDFHPLKKTSEEGERNGTVSGRFSSSHPNLQNIPVRDPLLGPLMRGLFIPEDGCDWWSLDQSQMEYRLLVHFSVAANCIGATDAANMYRSDPTTDFHKLASALTGLPRKEAKNVNFGIVYSMGVATLAAKLGISLEKAKEILDTYHGRMPFCRQVNKLASSRASALGYVRTILGRKRRFDLWEPGRYNLKEKRPDAFSFDKAEETYGKNKIKRAFTHKALNAVLQGSNADYTKKCMVDAFEAGLIGAGTPLTCQLTVHDELDGSCPREERSREAFQELKHLMMNSIKLHVPVLVEGDMGKNWHEAHH